MKVELDLAKMKKTYLGSESGSDESMHGWLFSEIDGWMWRWRKKVPIYIANVMRNQSTSSLNWLVELCRNHKPLIRRNGWAPLKMRNMFIYVDFLFSFTLDHSDSPSLILIIEYCQLFYINGWLTYSSGNNNTSLRNHSTRFWR